MEAQKITKMAYDAVAMSEPEWKRKYPNGVSYDAWRKAYFNKYGLGNIVEIRSDLPVADYVPMMYNAS